MWQILYPLANGASLGSYCSVWMWERTSLRDLSFLKLSSWIYQFYYSTTTRLRTRPCATPLIDECRFGTWFAEVWFKMTKVAFKLPILAFNFYEMDPRQAVRNYKVWYSNGSVICLVFGSPLYICGQFSLFLSYQNYKMCLLFCVFFKKSDNREALAIRNQTNNNNNN